MKTTLFVIGGFVALLITMAVTQSMGWAQDMYAPKSPYPKLHIAYIVLPDRQIGNACGKMAVACTVIDWTWKTCFIFIGDTHYADTVSHEERHCEGWTH